MKSKEINSIYLGDLTCKSYGNFMFLKLDDVLNFIKREYHRYDLVEFDYHESHYKLELKFRLTTQKTIEL